jgi:hypothetical protein
VLLADIAAAYELADTAEALDEWRAAPMRASSRASCFFTPHPYWSIAPLLFDDIGAGLGPSSWIELRRCGAFGWRP